MTENCKIRSFEPEDLARLQEIREAAFAPVFRSFRDLLGEEIASVALAKEEIEQARLLEEICKGEPGREVYVAERDGEIAGFCGLYMNTETKVGEIDLNAVHPDHQNKGVGSRLYAFVLDRLKQAGMTVATVGTGGDASHAPARRAYRKAGFGPSIPNVYMYRTL